MAWWTGLFHPDFGPDQWPFLSFPDPSHYCPRSLPPPGGAPLSTTLARWYGWWPTTKLAVRQPAATRRIPMRGGPLYLQSCVTTFVYVLINLCVLILCEELVLALSFLDLAHHCFTQCDCLFLDMRCISVWGSLQRCILFVGPLCAEFCGTGSSWRYDASPVVVLRAESGLRGGSTTNNMCDATICVVRWNCSSCADTAQPETGKYDRPPCCCGRLCDFCHLHALNMPRMWVYGIGISTTLRTSEISHQICSTCTPTCALYDK